MTQVQIKHNKTKPYNIFIITVKGRWLRWLIWILKYLFILYGLDSNLLSQWKGLGCSSDAGPVWIGNSRYLLNSFLDVYRFPHNIFFTQNIAQKFRDTREAQERVRIQDSSQTICFNLLKVPTYLFDWLRLYVACTFSRLLFSTCR